MNELDFEWDTKKEQYNLEKHGVGFDEAIDAFYDLKRIIAIDYDHSTPNETRYYCFGKSEKGIMTVRYTIRGNKIRIIGAGYWRGGKKEYEKKRK
jgi:uncharacterized DUF497 family protein